MREAIWPLACIASQHLTMLRMEVLLESNQAGRSDSDQAAVPGLIFSFLPAHGGSKATGLVEELCRAVASLGLPVLLAKFGEPEFSPWRTEDAPRRLDGRTWGAFVSARGEFDELDASEVHPRQLRPVLDYAAQHYAVICADLSGAKAVHSVDVLRASASIFVVSGSGSASLDLVTGKVAWLRSMNLEEHCALLLRSEPGGLGAGEAKARTGLRVTSFAEAGESLLSLAQWLAAEAKAEACAATVI